MANWVCSSCGGENPEGMKFCGHCGAGGEGAGRADRCIARRCAASPPAPSPSASSKRAGELPDERRLITALFADVPVSRRLRTESIPNSCSR